MKIRASGLKVFLSSVGVDDEEAILKNANDYVIAANTPGMPYPYNSYDAASFVDFAVRRYLQGLDFHMTVRLLDGEFVGMCAIANIDSQNQKAEVGYWIGKNYQGNDYAKQAISMIVEFGFVKLGLNRVYSEVFTTNEASIKLLNSLGFSNEGKGREEIFHMDKFHDIYRFGILKSEYKNKLGITVETDV